VRNPSSNTKVAQQIRHFTHLPLPTCALEGGSKTTVTRRRRSIKLAKLFEMVVDFDPRGGDWQATQIMRRLARLKLR